MSIRNIVTHTYIITHILESYKIKVHMTTHISLNTYENKYMIIYLSVIYGQSYISTHICLYTYDYSYMNTNPIYDESYMSNNCVTTHI